MIRTMGLRKTDKVVCHGLSVNSARVRCSVEHAPTDARGCLDYDGLEHVFDDSVRLLVVPMLELETGEELRFDSLVRMAHVHGCRVLVDTTCCVGYRSIDATALVVDLLLASGHGYLRGPPGVTACICHSENDALVLRNDAAFCGIDEAYVAPTSFCECYACLLRARILTCQVFFAINPLIRCSLCFALAYTTSDTRRLRMASARSHVLLRLARRALSSVRWDSQVYSTKSVS